MKEKMEEKVERRFSGGLAKVLRRFREGLMKEKLEERV